MANQDTRNRPVSNNRGVPPRDRGQLAERNAERYFQFEAYDNNSDDSGGFGFGHDTGETSRFGAGGMSPEPGHTPDNEDFRPGPQYFESESDDAPQRTHWNEGYPPVGGRGWGPTVPDYDRSRPQGALRSRWAEGQTAYAPSYPGPAKGRRDDENEPGERGSSGSRSQPDARIRHSRDARALEMTPDPAGFGLSAAWAPGLSDTYLNWRQRQIEELDADYMAYCEHCQNEFNSNFDTWRSGRGGSPADRQTPRAKKK